MAVAAVLVPVILEHRRWRQVDQEFSHVAELQRGRLHGILFERKKRHRNVQFGHKAYYVKLRKA